ncbi:putative protein TPRXL [Ctenocephalides felis]|uniref:putative protein TPRXL n=1 Tax=Ctenocephalides felis TaxID=7515 RepID=UPI000E6E1457|nr:putative protein TPRXL [Ctenocephalides felis]
MYHHQRDISSSASSSAGYGWFLPPTSTQQLSPGSPRSISSVGMIGPDRYQSHSSGRSSSRSLPYSTTSAAHGRSCKNLSPQSSPYLAADTIFTYPSWTVSPASPSTSVHHVAAQSSSGLGASSLVAPQYWTPVTSTPPPQGSAGTSSSSGAGLNCSADTTNLGSRSVTPCDGRHSPGTAGYQVKLLN